MSELAIYGVGKLVALFCFITSKVLAAEWHDAHGCTELSTADNVVHTKFPYGSSKLVKIEDIKYLPYFYRWGKGVTPFLGVALQAGCSCDVRIAIYGVESLFSIVITLQLTIFRSMSSLQYTIFKVSRVHLQCCEAQPISAISPKICTIKLQ